MGTILNRLLILGLLGGCAYLFGQTAHLQDELTQARSERAAAPRQTPIQLGSARAKPPPPPPRTDYLVAAQTHTQKAEQALAAGNVGDAWRESRAATQAARIASLTASAQTQRSLAEIKGRVSSVQEQAAKLWRKVRG